MANVPILYPLKTLARNGLISKTISHSFSNFYELFLQERKNEACTQTLVSSVRSGGNGPNYGY